MRVFDIDKLKLNVEKPNIEYDKFQNWQSNYTCDFSIEIGCGVGWHPIQWATQNPMSGLLAIERTHTKFEKFEKRLGKNSNPKNIFPAHADAMILLPFLLKPESVDKIFILYPNPYPKKKHKNLRFAHSTFSHFLSQCLKINGQIIIATNSQLLKDELSSKLPEQMNLKLKNKKIIPTDSKPRTHFEKKYLIRNEPCYEFIFTKSNSAFIG